MAEAGAVPYEANLTRSLAREPSKSDCGGISGAGEIRSVSNEMVGGYFLRHRV